MKRTLELLSPARDLACGIAAIDHGADAVYIGAPRFGARVAAGNSVDDIATLCRYAHQYDARVYVTVNTLIRDDELPALRSLLHQIAGAGTDAVLFQDMVVPEMVKADGLPLLLHASTQTDNRTAEKVEQMHAMGACRVVLARELSVQEIADIHRRVPDVELEVFVHGALCVSYSGLCNISEYCFNRSANRGECAQVCRMKFDLSDADGTVIEHDRHLLSLKDLNQSEHLAELIAAGAVSFKIEGRLKDAAYVKNVTAAYSQLLDRFISQHPADYERASLGRCRYTFTPDLRKTFNRGYTTYFLHGRQPGIFSPDTPKAMGEFVGTVMRLQGEQGKGGRHGVRGDRLSGKGVVVVAPVTDSYFPTSHPSPLTAPNIFANGDGLCFIDDNRELQGFRVNRADGNTLTVAGKLPPTLRRGMRLYRNNDQQMERILAGKSAERKIPLTMSLATTDDGYRLTVNDGRRRAEATIVCEHQQAQKPQQETIVRELSKLGNTPYECAEVLLPPGFGYFIPVSRLAELRRKCIDSIPTTPPRIPTEQQTTPIALRCGVGGEPSPPLMQCRHCLRYALGHCVKYGGTPPTWREPLFLSLANGRRFRLRFDCSNCQMDVISEST